MKKLLIILVFLLTVVSAHAADLRWDAASGTVDGYNVKYGTESGSYFMSMDVGNVMTVLDIVDTLQLIHDTKYYFIVTAYNSAGESAYSNEASYTTPIVLSVPGTVTITISTD